ncbi:hypothetical protein GMI69_04520 [Eggerthellaceae bacterium zg-887]|uniref:N-acetylmuramoyl-L-alanine amidase family protein n=1 Tax=Xiamenia xianingshaonis TaxID=2682776 RepID=UPI001409F642|nr:N-acetylmuramoyl-L-alanine amidase family protein [Xiamenia xianingshaonis]NHM15933.1 hypothetical protein [Xiamenia xianingshaonis]
MDTGKPAEATEVAAWTAVKISGWDTTTDFPYTGSAIVPSTENLKVLAEYSAWDNTGGTATYKGTWYSIPVASIDPTVAANAPSTLTGSNAVEVGSYKVTYTVKSDAAPSDEAANINKLLKSGGGSVENVQAFSITKAPVTVTFPGDQVLGAASPKSIYDDVTATAVPSLTKGTDYTVTLTDSKGVVLDNTSTAKFTEPTAVTVTVALEDGKKADYALGTDGTTSKTVDVAAATADDGQYTISWTTAGNVQQGTPATVGTASYTGSDLDIDTAISVKYRAAEQGSSEQTLDPSAFDITWIDNTRGNQVLADGKEPVIPGSYTAEFRPKGSSASAAPVGTLTLQVQGNLSGADAFGPIIATVDGRAPSAVQLQYKEGITEKDVIDQIVAGLDMAYETTGSTSANLVEVEDPTEMFEFKVTNFVANKDGQGGKVTMAYKGNDGAFTAAPLEFTYKFGTELPQVAALDALTYYPGGYSVASLLPSIKDEDGTIVTKAAGAGKKNYIVKAYTTNADGEEEEATVLTDAGTYKVTVEPDPDSSYVGDVQTLSLTINPVTVTAGKNATFTWDNKNTVNGTFSVSYTGGPAEPEPGVVVEWQTPPTGAADSAKDSATLSTDGLENKIVTKEVYDAAKPDVKKTYAAYVEYADNTAVTDNGAKATLTFVNNYAGVKEQTFSIKAADIAKLNGLDVSAASQMKDQFNADGELNAADVADPVVKFKPDPGVDAYTELEQGTDYRITRVWPSSKTSSTKGVTIYNFEVEGRGNYTGTYTGEFRVTTQDLGELAVASLAKGQEFFYDTNAHEAVVQVNLKGATADKPGAEIAASEYDVAYEDNVNAGTATATITGTGDYAGTLEVQFEIQPLVLDNAKTDKVVLSGAEDLVYSGKAFEPEVVWSKSKLTLADSESVESNPIPLSQYVDDLKFTYENNVNASTAEAPAYVVIEGKNGNFEGAAKVPFEIAQADIEFADVDGVAVAPGGELADAVKVTLDDVELAAGTDYTVAAEEGSTVPGTVFVTIEGTGNYTGTVEKDIDVLYDVADVQFEVAETTYNGKAQAPVVTAAYYMDGDTKVPVDASAYDVKAGSYTGAGTYPIAISGDRDAGWTGEKTVDFTIKPATVSAKPQVSYDAAGLPVVTVPGLSSNDFTYKADAATKTITVTYKGNYAGTATVAYAPAAKPVAPEQPAAGKTGWVGSGNDWAYYKDGQQVKNGWELIGGEWYHFEKSGKMTNTKWFQDADGEWYLLNQSHKGSYGAMLTGWQKVDGGWYYMGKSGDMQSGWAKVDGEWYLLNSKHDGTFGKMLTGWQQVGGKWYYMDASGAMAESEWVGRYWVDGSGVWTATR